MGLRINTNIAAMDAYRNLSTTQSEMNKSLEKLSSGYRINRAADDAAGLAISEGLRSQIGGLKVAGRNTQDAINVVQTADGALNETTSILQRMRDLSVQASNDGGLDTSAKSDIQAEMTQLKSELDRIATTTTFNGKNLLDGSYTGTFQVGANAGETISVGIGTAMNASGLGVAGVDVTKTATGALTSTHAAEVTGTSGASETTNTVDFTSAANNDQLNGTLSYGGHSLDLGSLHAVDDTTGWATGTASDTTTNLGALQAAVDQAFGKDANGNSNVNVSISGTSLAFTVADVGTVGDSVEQVAARDITFTGQSGASAAITKITDAIQTVSNTRANLGAYQNRFEHTINNINVAVENLSASESAIRDTDMASEMVNFTRTQILSQAGTAMLAQANHIPDSVLKLLQ